MRTHVQYILVAILLALSTGAHAGFPSGWPYAGSETLDLFRGTLAKNKGNFARRDYNSSFTQMKAAVNKNYASCQFKKAPAKGIASILYWDFKLKLRLNRNMNIIFSYN